MGVLKIFLGQLTQFIVYDVWALCTKCHEITMNIFNDISILCLPKLNNMKIIHGALLPIFRWEFSSKVFNDITFRFVTSETTLVNHFHDVHNVL